MLIDLLKQYSASGVLPMHMPGHKRRALFSGLPHELDITEISGFDNLHDMTGVLRGTALLAARLYGAGAAFPLVGGSTAGVLAAIRTFCPERSGSLVMSRTSHRCVYSAAELCGLAPVYIPTERDAKSGILGGSSAESVRRILESSPDARAVVVTSPSYDGAVSDIASIAALTKRAGVALIVDAAHGAHFGFSPEFPQNAVRLGADAEVVSLHKTLPAMTQTALLLLQSPDMSKRAQDALRVFETTSPSYVLLASIDACLNLLQSRGIELFADWARALREFDGALNLKSLRRVSSSDSWFGFDPGKIAVSTVGTDVSGARLMELLRT
ncbi:MAG: aminotransferase class I/II-fold pyridoxal phosphate-dependent enzyme, partial [Oscillospiraceae bacterium]|nr:aminotransferase class I/II-fold pyridoxal phosphate-dependent enzyme [Oscillospiraceae bacterium]